MPREPHWTAPAPVGLLSSIDWGCSGLADSRSAKGDPVARTEIGLERASKLSFSHRVGQA